MTNPTTAETARALLHRHGLPEDVIDGALCLHAQELAALQRLRMDELDLTGQKARFVGRIVDLIDPTKTAAPAVPLPSVDRAADVRDQLLPALDFNYVVSLGYSGPEELLAAYDASRTPVDRAAVQSAVADAVYEYREATCLWGESDGVTEEIARRATRAALDTLGARPSVDRAALRDRIAEAALHAVETALGDTLLPAAREEALAGIVAVLPESAPTDEVERLRLQNERMRHELKVMYGGAFDSPDRARPVDRDAVLREAADAIAAHPGPIPWLPGLPKGDGDGFWWDTRDRDAAAALLRRMADETPAAPTTADKAAHLGMTPNDYRAASHRAAVDQIRAALPGLYATVGLRVEAALEADETQPAEASEAEKLAKAGRMAAAMSAPPVAPPEWATTTEWPGRHKRPGDRRVHATARFVVNDKQRIWTACKEHVGQGGTPLSHMPVDCRACQRATAAGAPQDGAGA